MKSHHTVFCFAVFMHCILPLRHVGVFLTNDMNISHALRATELLVPMHSGIVNGHQLLCYAHTVLEPHKGTAALFLFYSRSSFSIFSFMCLSLWQSYFFSWVPCINNLKRTADLILWFPDRTSVCTYPWLDAYITL